MIDTPKVPEGLNQVIRGQTVSGPNSRPAVPFPGNPNQVLEALVQSRDSAGNPVLRIPGGELTVSSLLPLSIGSSLLLRPLPNGGVPVPQNPQSNLPFFFQAKIITIDGKPPEVQNAPTGQSGQPPSNAGDQRLITGLKFSPDNVGFVSRDIPTITSYAAPGVKTDSIALSGGARVEAEILTANTMRSSYQSFIQATSPNAVVKSGDQLVLQVVRIETTQILSVTKDVPANNVQPNNAGEKNVQQGNVSVPAGPQLVENAAQVLSAYMPSKRTEATPLAEAAGATSDAAKKAPSRVPATFIANQQVPVTDPVSPQRSGHAAHYHTTPPPLPLLPGMDMDMPEQMKADLSTAANNSAHSQQFSAYVVGTEKSGNVIAHTPLGTIQLMGIEALPAGTTLTMEVMQWSPAPASAQAGAASAVILPTLVVAEEQRAAIENVVLVAHASRPELMPHIKPLLPADPTLAVARSLWFLAAIKQNMPQWWLGRDVASAMLKELPDAYGRLASHINQLHYTQEQTPAQQWKATPLPYFNGQEWEDLRFYHKQESRAEECSAENSPERFVVELTQSSYGKMQFDGLMQNPHGSKKYLSMVLRAEKKLPDAVQKKIQGLFIATLDSLNIHGRVEFVTVKEFTVDPEKEMLSMSNGSNIIFA